jgi:rhodanese-related sulfurtransferase
VGSNPYGRASPACFAALHAGLTRAEGGDVILLIDPEPSHLSGSSANGLVSSGLAEGAEAESYRLEPISGDHVDHPTETPLLVRTGVASAAAAGVLILLTVIVVVYFLLARRLYLEIVETGGDRHQFVFRRSVIEGETVDMARFEELASLLEGLLKQGERNAEARE